MSEEKTSPVHAAPAARPRAAREPERKFAPPRHIVWSTDSLDRTDPFQRRYYIRQVLTHGRMEDIRTLDLHEVARLLDELRLPPVIHSLWERFFREHDYASG